MRKEDARQVVDEQLAWMRWAFQLQAWEITVQFDRLRAGVQGECLADSRYLIATITIDSEQIDDPDRVLGVLRHELLHILHSEFDHVVNSAREEFEGSADSFLFQMHRAAQEKTVGMLERMLDHGLGATPDRLVGMASLNRRRGDLSE